MVPAQMILRRVMLAWTMLAQMLAVRTIMVRARPDRRSNMRGNLAPRLFIGGGGLQGRRTPFRGRFQRLLVIRRKRRVGLSLEQRKDRGGIEGLRRWREARRPQDAQELRRASEPPLREDVQGPIAEQRPQSEPVG